ncbi:MAG: c-type cytochrome [Acidobacteria bacterium]|nr:MAG: c-type cytochrome [Acidobacteriota bacterium]
MQMRFVITAVFMLLPLCAQEKQEKQDKGKRPIPNPTNLKVLKVTTGPEVTQIMRTFTSGLGVQCNFCHVQGNFASDDNPKKEVARHMIEMATEINSKFTDGKMHVTCYTCHRGEPEPKTAPEPRAAQ